MTFSKPHAGCTAKMIIQMASKPHHNSPGKKFERMHPKEMHGVLKKFPAIFITQL
jgi:hypothetical protein